MSDFVLRVLLVDGDLFLHRIQSALITKFGHQVQAVATGEEALSLLEAGSADVDLVLMDMMMPGMDGLETTRKHISIKLLLNYFVI
ncbi:response regulator [Thiomicrospira sp. R3]|uniref:response regulator n=1 Tax=Thiomicrospira sp. R3 TaxID=3035472 RepID=UPI00259B9521|nr:response regulator [Thiomicrospira sp. R3]WFE69526.1 response regulator [Thiomicrospira sp. R3]